MNNILHKPWVKVIWLKYNSYNGFSGQLDLKLYIFFTDHPEAIYTRSSKVHFKNMLMFFTFGISGQF